MIFHEYDKRPEEFSIYNLTETMLNDLIINKILSQEKVYSLCDVP